MTPQHIRLILASASPWRATMLRNAGIEVEPVPAMIDEREIEKTLEGSDIGPDDVAQILSQAKADEVSQRHPGAAVIGADQTLSLEGEIMHKPRTMDEAIDRLLTLSGRTHQLNSGVCLIRDGEVLWSHVEVTHITFHKLDAGFVGRHLAEVGAKALTSVGAYQVEGPGAQLIEKIDGDFFSVIGLPLLPLLAELRQRGFIDS